MVHDAKHYGGLQGADTSRPIDAIFLNSPLRDYDVAIRRHSTTLPVLGLAYIATYCRVRGMNVGVIDAEALGLGVSAIADTVNEYRPRWVALNLLAPTYQVSVAILQRIDSRIQVMLGGHHAKAMPQRIVDDHSVPRVDALIVGEGEYRAYEILRDIDARKTLPQVFWRSRTGCEAGECSSGQASYWLAPDAEQLPFVARDFLANDPFTAEDGRTEANLVGSRGCPYDCAFCGAARSANPDVAIRTRTPGNILAEMEALARSHGVNAFRFVDDLFLANARFMSDCMHLFSQARVGQRFRWDATGRINVLAKAPDALLDAMASGGCREIALGIESGSDRLLRYMDKSITAEMARTAVRRLVQRGINVKGYFILGYPTETRADIDATIALVNALWDLSAGASGSFRCSIFEFRPYPGTPEWHRLLGTTRYSESDLLRYEAVAAPSDDPLLCERDEFNFSVNLQFSDVPLAEVRSVLYSLMTMQLQRTAACEQRRVAADAAAV